MDNKIFHQGVRNAFAINFSYLNTRYSATLHINVTLLSTFHNPPRSKISIGLC